MKKQLLKGVEARRKLENGVNKLADIVVTTLGPRGRNVAIARTLGAPRVVHDGVTVAKSIFLEDPFEDQGAQLVKEASDKTNTLAGDGTTTATLLTQAIINEGMKATTPEIGDLSPKVNAMKLRKELEDASLKVIEEIRKIAKKVTTLEQKKNIATISSQDEEIGNLIADALKLVGDNGIIAVGEGKGNETSIEHREGMMISRGYVSPYFITDQQKQTVEIENAHVLVTDLDINSIDPMIDFFNSFIKKNTKLLIIATNLGEQAIAMLVMNKDRGALEPIAIKSPSFGYNRVNLLEDVAIVTGATFIRRDSNTKIEDIRVEHMGFAEKVKSTAEETTIIGGSGDKEKIKERIAEIKRLLKEEDSDAEKDKLNDRLAKLSGGIALIHAGGATETEVEEKKLRIEDAVHATRAAMEEGIVPGGGVIMLRAREVIKDQKTAGEKILYKALERPVRTVLSNAGEDVDYVLDKMKTLETNFGYDVVGERFVDMLEAGIIDPAKVTIQALINAVSVASMVLTTEAIVVDVEDKKEEKCTE